MSTCSPNPAAPPTRISDAPDSVNAPAEDTCMQDQDKPKDIDDEQHHDVADDAVSETNTMIYGQEPFETIQHKVAALAAKIFGRDPRDITVYEMKGGSYNRVIGVSIAQKPKRFTLAWFLFPCLRARKKKAATKSESYVVRVPRMEYNNDESMAQAMEREVSILKAAGSRLPLPIPKVASYDLTTANIFERPYMIQTHLPGRTLATNLWNNLNMEQKKHLAKEIIALAPTIASVEGSIGDISSQNLNKPPTSPILTQTFYITSREGFKPEPALNDDPFDYMLGRCKQWSEYHNSEDAPFDDIWISFARITKALEARGFLEGPCVLVHGDLKCYNILAEVRSDTEAVVTGVIDWDTAIIAPEFMAYRAPFSLWTPEDMPSAKEDDESVANVEPVTEEDKILKQVFLDNASEKYKFFAFAPEAMLARRMFYIMQKGANSPWYNDEAISVVKAWDKLHPEDNVRFRYDWQSDSEAESDSDDEPTKDDEPAKDDKTTENDESTKDDEPGKDIEPTTDTEEDELIVTE
ncbi:uncharacterized protein J4E92_007561 [Alternaria infectoria]|uniref:uncharacterized protein n=1 Tax=Alternaria infectoria TaxID=45303 RepID=UPI002220C861|nr:uncharacterized protein J4E92_007561 [Alternaria infectoria]KAI4923587.1 hypothetical protein J4E92_007561 [Alternaria infectoria]